MVNCGQDVLYGKIISFQLELKVEKKKNMCSFVRRESEVIDKTNGVKVGVDCQLDSI